jgi:hypothetical protein
MRRELQTDSNVDVVGWPLQDIDAFVSRVGGQFVGRTGSICVMSFRLELERVMSGCGCVNVLVAVLS